VHPAFRRGRSLMAGHFPSQTTSQNPDRAPPLCARRRVGRASPVLSGPTL